MTSLRKLIRRFFLRWNPKAAVALADKLDEIEIRGLAAQLRSCVDTDRLTGASFFHGTCRRVEDLVYIMGMTQREAFPKNFVFEKWLNSDLAGIVKKNNLCGFEWNSRSTRLTPKQNHKFEPFAPRRTCTLEKNHISAHEQDLSVGLIRTSGVIKRKKAA